MRDLTCIRVALAMVAALLLASCGGGSSLAGGVGSGGTGASVGTAQVALTDAPGSYDHVWITVAAIRFHADGNVGPDDNNWQTSTLATPVTVDLAALSNGGLTAITSGISLPVGTYHQLLLVLADSNAGLSASAQAQGISYNNEVDYTDTTGTHSVRLDVPNAVQGIRVQGNFTVSAGQTLKLALDFNIDDDVVPYQAGGSTGFALTPTLGVFDLDHAGALAGQINLSSLGSGMGNLVIHAEQRSPDGLHNIVIRSTRPAADGSFLLYPLPTSSGSTNVDLVVRGKGIATTFVRGVVVAADSSKSQPSPVSSHPLSLVASIDYTTTLSAPINPSGAALAIMQTLPGTGELPYPLLFRLTDPFMGTLNQPLALPSGTIQVGNYVAGGDPVFSAVTPQEGLGGYTVIASAPGFVAPPVTLLPSAGGGPATLNFGPSLPNNTSLILNGISGTISQATPFYDSGFLIITQGGRLVRTEDLRATLAQNGGLGGNYQIRNVAGGSAGNPAPDAIYYAYVRVWNSAHPVLTQHVQAISGSADLRTGNASGFNALLVR